MNEQSKSFVKICRTENNCVQLKTTFQRISGALLHRIDYAVIFIPTEIVLDVIEKGGFNILSVQEVLAHFI